MMTDKIHKRPGPQGHREVRVYATPQKLEVRRAADGTRSLQGYFASYTTLSHDLGGFRERLAPGCFDKSLSEQPVSALVNHDDNKLLGKIGHNLTVVSDSVGLRFQVNPLPDTSYSKDLIALAEQGLVDSCSFGFLAISEEWSLLPDGTPLRTVTEAVIFEGSILAGPEAAYPRTSVSVRARRRAKAKRDNTDPTLDCDPDELDDDGNCPDEDDEDELRCSCPCDACEGCQTKDEERGDRLRNLKLKALSRARTD